MLAATDHINEAKEAASELPLFLDPRRKGSMPLCLIISSSPLHLSGGPAFCQSELHLLIIPPT